MKVYDYIILGAGASGLMLAYRLAQDSFFNDKSILIIDKNTNKGNDRTWCFWENGEGEWDAILYKSWKSIYFGSSDFRKTINISPFCYKMIRSEAFYKMLWESITSRPNIEFKKTTLINYSETSETVLISTSEGDYNCRKLFNSIPNLEYLNQDKYPVLQQHFLGWFVKTKTDVFDDSVATFMDFSVPQNSNTRFMYVLPIDKKTALFEYTLFSKDLLNTSEYEDAIRTYLEERNINDYEIIEKERGCIPMTVYNFSKLNTKNVLNIGTAGGWTKASTGYTFRNTSKKTKQLINFLKSKDDFRQLKPSKKYRFYDLIFLDVLANHNETGADLFTNIFKRTNVKTIFKFLDEESTLWEDLKIILSVPKRHFISAFFKRLF